MRIVFCCTGNTCRSPLAEYLLKDNLRRNNISGANISSCGIECMNEITISKGSLAVLAEIGIDASEHQAKSITVREVLEADYIFTMTHRQKEWLAANMNAIVNVMTLGEFVCGGDVIDPYMGSTLQYRECREKLSCMINRLAEKLF